jgi:hypothetical protein
MAESPIERLARSKPEDQYSCWQAMWLPVARQHRYMLAFVAPNWWTVTIAVLPSAHSVAACVCPVAAAKRNDCDIAALLAAQLVGWMMPMS